MKKTKKSKSKLITTQSDWTPEILQRFYNEIERIATDYLKLKVYPNQIEIISSEQMLDAYSSVAMPIMYPHWSFGKQFIAESNAYNRGHMNLAYEVVINCLSEETLVTTDCGITTLKEVKVGDNVWNGQTFVNITHKQQSIKPTYTITLDNNINLLATAEHIHSVIDGQSGNVVTKLTTELTESDWLIQPQQGPNIVNNVDLSDFSFVPPRCGYGERYSYQPYCKIPFEMNEALAELLGILVGDGCVSHTMKRAFYIAVGHDAEGYENHVISLIKEVFDIDAHVYEQPSSRYPDRTNKNIYVLSNEIKEFIEYCGLKKTMTHKNKEVPHAVLQSSTNCHIAFLRGLFDTDGCVKTSNGVITNICFSAVNKRLVDQVSIMLTNIGICNTIRTVKHQQIYVLDMLSTGNKQFAKIIYSNHTKKRQKMDTLIGHNETFRSDSGIMSKLPPSMKINQTRGQYLKYNDNQFINQHRFIKIKQIENSLKQTNVVDITVNSPDHLFVANGVLTHNCSPCIAYCMEENTAMMQALVIAHACFGHNTFFANNYLFKMWTDAEAIIDYLVFAKRYIEECEEQYGVLEVEKTLDACHALMNYGVDRYKRPVRLSLAEERDRQTQREEYMQSQVNDIWRTIPKSGTVDIGRIRFNERDKMMKPLDEPQENILYFLEKNAPNLETWQREILRIVRKIAQYFYPQRQTQLMNEGMATFTHYNIINKLYDEGLVNDGFMLEFIESHTAVTAQRGYDSKYFSGINPYALGFAMYQDIKRVCIEPTDEDREWFGRQEWVGRGDWIETTKWAAFNFKDESFVRQFLSPKLIRDFRLFTILDDQDSDEYVVTSIHNREGYEYIRDSLANQYTLTNNEPNIQITHVHFKGDRSLYLTHNVQNGKLLDEKDVVSVMTYMYNLWQFDVVLDSIKPDGSVMASYAIRDGKPLIEYYMDDQ